MKKIALIMITVALALSSFTACSDTGSNENSNSGKGNSSSENQSTELNGSVDQNSGESKEEAATGEGFSVIEGDIISADSEGSAEVDDSSAVDTTPNNGTADENYAPLSDKAYTLYLKNNGDGTYTLTGVIPANVGSGKMVVCTSGDLSLVEGSLSTTVAPNAINEKYNRNGIKGACVVFASTGVFEEGAIVFSATYKATEGATVSEEDVTIPDWNLTTGSEKIASNEDTEVVIKYVD